MSSVQVELFAFWLMSNHFHFAIESAHHQSLSQFMPRPLTGDVRPITNIMGAAGIFGRAV
jgi:REP element-mobilizing transposase RayT